MKNNKKLHIRKPVKVIKLFSQLNYSMLNRIPTMINAG